MCLTDTLSAIVLAYTHEINTFFSTNADHSPHYSPQFLSACAGPERTVTTTNLLEPNDAQNIGFKLTWRTPLTRGEVYKTAN